MCGIVGYWSVAPVELLDLATFTDMLAHRGPDGFGYLTAEGNRVGLGQRRLAILDPEPRSRQPMVTDDGRYAIVFNGEIYNFIEVRDQLGARGHRFQTDSDTEVVLHAYAEWGADCQDRFNGMWAFVIWDNASRSLFFSRDRFGVKPLLLLETPNGVAFASEAKAFFALPWSTNAGSNGGLAALPAMQGVRSLKAGTCATLRGPAGPLEGRRWWDPLRFITPEPASYPQQVERFRDLFFDACRLRLRSDVPVGTAISGGMDSSSVLAVVNAMGPEAIARRPGDWSRAFTIVAPNTEHDELEYARAACEAAGVNPVVIDLFQRVDVGDIDDYLYLTDGMPLTNLPAWYLYRSMREQGIRVSLDGQGADEVLAGYYYDVFRAIRLESSWLRRPLRTFDLVKTAHALTQDSPYVRQGGLQGLVLSSPPLRWALTRFPIWRSRFPVFPQGGYDAEMWEMARTLPPLNSVLFMAINDGIQDLLERYDMLSMSSGLEIRMPFLDWRLVSYTLSLPPESILGNGFTKRILRDAMAPYLPRKVLNRRRKLQFQGPIRPLLQGQLRSWMDPYVDSRGSSPDVLAAGTYTQVRRLGRELVGRWKNQAYPRLVKARVADLRARHRLDPGRVEQHTHVMPGAHEVRR